MDCRRLGDGLLQGQVYLTRAGVDGVDLAGVRFTLGRADIGQVWAHSWHIRPSPSPSATVARRPHFALRQDPSGGCCLQIMADEAAQYGGATIIVCGPESFVSAVAVSVKPFPGKFRFVHESFRW